MKANRASEAVLRMDTLRKTGSKRFWQTRRFKNNLPLWVMFVPVIAFYIIFKYTPMLGLVIAFKNYTFYEGYGAASGSAWTISPICSPRRNRCRLSAIRLCSVYCQCWSAFRFRLPWRLC